MAVISGRDARRSGAPFVNQLFLGVAARAQAVSAACLRDCIEPITIVTKAASMSPAAPHT